MMSEESAGTKSRISDLLKRIADLEDAIDRKLTFCEDEKGWNVPEFEPQAA